ncbi:polysaccharide pyruvyl transferase family protein [Chryseolinea sp. T2]|uniref:polysaccharide pyruvyl transferase family protein n=1 Tax=Chryseolinea sp. T2 TaxID=3129255 RepID=UPI0030781194
MSDEVKAKAMKRISKLVKAFKSRMMSSKPGQNVKFWRDYKRFNKSGPFLRANRIQDKPSVINLNANDICNSKCVMCNIWQQKQDYEITPKDLYNILSNDLFSEVRAIGITGGEPTLRADIHELYAAAIDALPKLEGLSIITNAIKSDDVIERIDRIHRLCLDRSISFSMMVSVDGVGTVHDSVRRREGNFESAIRVLEYFNKKIDTTIGCTISTVNVWDVDELLFFVQKRGYKARFRIAEFIKRLYNEDLTVIRNFDADETYHLLLFFHKLMFNYEKNPLYLRTYKSIINQLMGGKRLIECPYQKGGMVLNSRGEIAYCAPKSKIIGSGLLGDSSQVYYDNLDEKRTILKNYCDSCIHDYHDQFTSEGKFLIKKDTFWKRHLSLDSKTFNWINTCIVGEKSKSKTRPKVLILGWYGTETVGDKAILGGIVEELRETHYRFFDLEVASIFPFITERTLQELQIEGTVVAAYSRDFVVACSQADVIVMGGGPLMDLEELSIPLRGFEIGKKYGALTIVYGCGLGPLSFEKYRKVVKRILRLSDVIKLRDKASANYAKDTLRIGKEIQVVSDPAKRFVNARRIDVKQDNILRCYLREWTYEYNAHLSKQEFAEQKEKFELALANYVKRKAKELNVDEIYFEHMHNFAVGNDDRDFSRVFLDRYFSDFKDVPVSYNKRLSTVDSIVASMMRSRFNICMRFHAVLFAHTLKTSFAAIDYTNGGKILNYLKDADSLDHLVSVNTLLKNYGS